MVIHQEVRDKVPRRRERLLLIRPPLPFGFTVAPKGQAETFVFHYEVRGGICQDGDGASVCREGKVPAERVEQMRW